LSRKGAQAFAFKNTLAFSQREKLSVSIEAAGLSFIDLAFFVSYNFSKCHSRQGCIKISQGGE
jgi:hypothetical protein